MTFLSPVFLYGLCACLLPLLIHLLNRKRMITVPFSNVALLRQLQRDRMRRVRIRQIVLLIVRTLILALAALAFARPTLRPTSVPRGAAHARTAAALLIDRSYSMGYRTHRGRLFDRAKARAAEALRLFDAEDKAWLVPFSDGPSSEVGTLSGGLSAAKEQLVRLDVTNRASRVADALEAAGRLPAEGLQREVYLFTDLARSGWDGVADSLAAFQGATVFILPERPVRVDNVAVTRFSVSNQIVMMGSLLSLEVEVRNAGGAEREIPIRLHFGGRQLGQKVLPLAAGETKRAAFHATPEVAGKVTATVVAGDDPLPVDNLRHLVLDVPGRIRTTLIGQTEQDNYYVERALNAAGERSFVLTRSLAGDQVSPQDVVQSDLLILSGVTRPPPGLLAALVDRATQGGGVILILGPGIDESYYNQRVLPALFPLTRGALRGTPGEHGAYRSLGDIDRQHPIFRDLLPEKFEPPRFFASFDLAPGPSTSPGALRTIAQFGDGGAALLETRLGSGRVLLLPSAIDLRWSDLALRGLFVPLMCRMAQYAVSREPGIDAYLAGQKADRFLFTAGGRATVIDPDGNTFEVREGSSPDGVAYRVGPLEVPGIWRVRSGGREVDRFAVAVDAAREADMEPVSLDRLERIFGRARLRVVEPEESLEQVAKESRYGRELWRHFLAAAMALMAAELLVGRLSASRSRAEAGGQDRPPR